MNQNRRINRAALVIILAIAVFGSTENSSVALSVNDQYRECNNSLGQEKHETRGPESGCLILHGGGSGKNISPDDPSFPVIEKLARKSIKKGQALNVVVIPTAKPKYKDSKKERETLKSIGQKALGSFGSVNIEFIHTLDRKKANQVSFCKPLETANLVIILGGYPSRLTKAYRGTRVHRMLDQVLKRNGVIAGASAGAIVQGSNFSRAPAGERGFGWISNCIVDVHVTKRKRQKYLSNKFEQKKFGSRYLGVGIDESMLVIVKQDIIEVVGKKRVHITNPSRSGSPKMLTLRDGDRYHLRDRKRLKPKPENPW